MSRPQFVRLASGLTSDLVYTNNGGPQGTCYHVCYPCTLLTAGVLMKNARLTSLLMLLHRVDRLQVMVTDTTSMLSLTLLRGVMIIFWN